MVENAKNEVAEKKALPPSLNNLLNQKLKGYADEFKKVLPAHVGADRFLRICSSEITKNPLLLECTPNSFLGSVMLSAQMGLEIGSHLGHSFLIPYRNKTQGKVICSLQFGYKGLIELVRRSDKISSISAQIVYENDFIEIDPLQNTVNFRPLLKGDRGKWYLAVAVAKFKNGDQQIDFMTKEQIMKRKAVAQGASIWNAWEEEMAKKTVLKSLCKLLPLSIEDQRLVHMDEKVITKLDNNLNGLIENSEPIYELETQGELNSEEKAKTDNPVDDLFNK
jgi:recombination protein RecT